MPNFAGSGRPLPAEYDLSGVIDDGNGTEFSKGDEVFGFLDVRTSCSKYNRRCIIH